MNDKPEIQFVNTDVEVLKKEMIAEFEKLTGRTLYPADPERLIILWAANAIVQERVNLNWAAKQNLPRFSEGDTLDYIAELFKGVSRLPASAAVTTMRFYLSGVLDSAQLIPAGTRVATDNGMAFETTEAVYIPAGETYIDAAARCQTLGAIGNGLLPGQINKLVDLFPYFDHCENITTSAGGADRESDSSLYQRMRASEDTYSTAGPMGGYEYFAKSVNSSIADVKANTPSPGRVNVYLLMEGGALPDKEMLEAVKTALSADDVRPLTDFVETLPPETVSYDIDITYYIPSDANASTVEAALVEALDSYKLWQSEKLGRDVNPDELVYRLKAAGIKRVELRAPVFTVVNDGRENNAAQVAVLNQESVKNGGYEDE